MKTLYILRHGEKNSINPNDYDYDIELSAKGLEDSKTIGKKLKEKGIKPDLIVSSPAIRARTTAEIVAKEISYKKNIMYNEVIYQAFLNELVESITYTFDNVDTLMIVGHNPSLTALAITFAGFKEELKMANAIRIDFDCNSWTAIEKENAKFIELFEV